MEVIKALCLGQLEGMSKKRIFHVLAGKPSFELILNHYFKCPSQVISQNSGNEFSKYLEYETGARN